MKRKIKITEEQLKQYINNVLLKEEGECAGATSTFSVGAETTRGDIGYDSPKAISLKTKKNKKDPSVTPEGRSPENDLKSLYGK